MTTARADLKTLWQARLKWIPRYVEVPANSDTPKKPAAAVAVTEGADAEQVVLVRVWSCFVEVFRPGCDPLHFRVNLTKSGRITFSDRRDCQTGILGTTGLWGTRPPLRVPRPRSLTPTAFKVEVARLVGQERAERLLSEIRERVSCRISSEDGNSANP